MVPHTSNNASISLPAGGAAAVAAATAATVLLASSKPSRTASSPNACGGLGGVAFAGVAPTTVAGLIKLANMKRSAAISAAAKFENTATCNTKRSDVIDDPTFNVDVEYATALLKSKKQLQAKLQDKLRDLQALRAQTTAMRKRRNFVKTRRGTNPTLATATAATAAVAAARGSGAAAIANSTSAGNVVRPWHVPPPIPMPGTDEPICCSPVSIDHCEDSDGPDDLEHYEHEHSTEEEVSFKQCAIYSA